ncbi:MAG TPA: putative LPS assembly protein LptD, partial [Saprospiraceae bacterium]|nr:putative LPS assembly protein LptD [Saprospiraceae bacterium]
MKYINHILILLILSVMVSPGHAQDTLINKALLKGLIDSLFEDTIVHQPPAITRNPEIFMSPDSLDATVEYGSADSNYLDNVTRKVHLFGDAYVRYKDLSLKADYIVVDLDSSIATAEGLLDSVGKLAGIPEFKMGEESFTAEKMRYNFVKRKGIIYNALTKEGDLTIHGEKTKFVAGGLVDGPDDDILYGSRALITTCDHPEPHFGIRASKVKTIPDKLAVIGSSNMELFGVPTPIWLPFGFYPVSETRSAGLILPRDYERSPQLGFGIRDIGYYFPVSDWADVKLLADIYFNGTYGLGIASNYAKKYKFRGNVALRYSYRITEPSNDYRENVEKSFSIRLTHNQDTKANPYQTIGGSINIQSNDFESLNYNDAQSALTNTYSSNFNYSRTFAGKP